MKNEKLENKYSDTHSLAKYTGWKTIFKHLLKDSLKMAERGFKESVSLSHL